MSSSVRIHGAPGETVRFVRVSLVVLFTYVFLANAWIGDTDPLLHTYYEKLRNVTRASVFRMSRLRDIWSLNVEYRNLKDVYQKRQPIVLSFPANHPRFQTAAGFRDDRARVMRTTGKGGYLQYGPTTTGAARTAAP